MRGRPPFPGREVSLMPGGEDNRKQEDEMEDEEEEEEEEKERSKL
jgi:hypothetical protein